MNYGLHDIYSVTVVVGGLCWVDSDLRCSSGWWAATIDTYCPRKIPELSQLNQVLKVMGHTVVNIKNS